MDYTQNRDEVCALKSELELLQNDMTLVCEGANPLDMSEKAKAAWNRWAKRTGCPTPQEIKQGMLEVRTQRKRIPLEEGGNNDQLSWVEKHIIPASIFKTEPEDEDSV